VILSAGVELGGVVRLAEVDVGPGEVEDVGVAVIARDTAVDVHGAGQGRRPGDRGRRGGDAQSKKLPESELQG